MAIGNRFNPYATSARTARARLHNEDKDVSGTIDVEPGRTFAGFGFTIALGNLRSRLLKGEQIELKAVGFAPKPFYRPLTKFENRGLKLGHGVWDVVFRKRDTAQA